MNKSFCKFIEKKWVRDFVKNNGCFYGAIVRDICILDISFEEFAESENDVTAICSRSYIDIVERDLFPFIKTHKIIELTSRAQIGKIYVLEVDDLVFCVRVRYIDLYENFAHSMDLSSPLRKLIKFDVNLLVLGRTGISMALLPKTHAMMPFPYENIIKSIQAKEFSYVGGTTSYDSEKIFNMLKEFKLEGWTNLDVTSEVLLPDSEELEDLEESEKCPICRERMMDDKDSIIIKLECGHMFHRHCMEKHIKSHVTNKIVMEDVCCPICRKSYKIWELI
jgi:hypothetical protein